MADSKMKRVDYKLTSPDGVDIVTGDGSERARLLGAGWTEEGKKTTRKDQPPKSSTNSTGTTTTSNATNK